MRRKAYISYSMDDKEMYILSSISKFLSEKDFFIYSSYDNLQTGLQISQAIKQQIAQCDLFIGIASHSGIKSDWVLKEWNIAQELGKTAIFLVEDTINLNPEFMKQNSVIKFNRHYPQQSLIQLQNRIDSAKAEKSNNAMNWIIGGLIGIAIIKLLSDE